MAIVAAALHTANIDSAEEKFQVLTRLNRWCVLEAPVATNRRFCAIERRTKGEENRNRFKAAAFSVSTVREENKTETFEARSNVKSGKQQHKQVVVGAIHRHVQQVFDCFSFSVIRCRSEN